MHVPIIDLGKPECVVRELFDDDRWIKDEFSKNLSLELLALSEAIARCYSLFPSLDVLVNKDEQAAFVVGFVHGVFDDVLTSSKLLVSGKLIASGNLMRQAIEGVAVALLCACREQIVIPKKKQAVKVHYWSKVRDGDRCVSSHKSLEHLRINCALLRLNRDGVEDLIRHRKFYHQLSHPSQLALAHRVSLGEASIVFAGGAYDDAKLAAYRKEVIGRTNFCRTLPPFVARLKEELQRGREAN